jgi:hypothetical protein
MQSQEVEQLSVLELHLLFESPGFLFLLSVCFGQLFFPEEKEGGQEGAGTC